MTILAPSRREHQVKEATFWLCWSPKGTTVPKHRHATLEEAEAEARRLIENHGVTPVYVLQAVGVAHREKPPVLYEAIP